MDQELATPIGAGTPRRSTTRFTGSVVPIDNFQEFGAFLAVGTLNPIRFGLTYLTGARGVQSFSVNLGARF